ncbi:MAG: ATP-binding protein [Acidobacteria bacterium]|nr:ATP-binding protein [Acidobacteriota bacterium]
MKRINEKVKDLVEVRSYKSLHDFFSDPAETLAAYHFTDATSDMMSKWIDRIGEVEHGSGRAMALAGYRGVGKSHFLATLGAIVSQPELRSRITEQHVSVSTQRLKRRRYPVAFVRRGTQPTFLEELKEALGKTFGLDPAGMTNAIPDLLKMAAEKSGDLPFIMIADTAFERTSRVSRDDGVLLGEIAEFARPYNIFVAVALDDDIAGADGVNAAIARTYSIDYLDQEHLYRIVDTHVFPKNRQKQPLLQEIYTYFREVLPNFRWSQQRFSALYPLHPVILETAPFVRLYAPEFALLGFASEAGSKILGRPANSLIALDEVFDFTEKSLRKVADLEDAFAAYDRLNAEIVGTIPVMQRLQAKLILKGLLLLSLDGDGTTAGEICAAMLIFDENDPANGMRMVENLLDTFVQVLPDQIWRRPEEGRGTRYSLKVSLKENLNKSLTEAIARVSPAIVPKILKRIARERFSDWTFTDESEGRGANWTDSQILWRGGLRRGRLCWNLENSETDIAQIPVNLDVTDWMVVISGENQPLPLAEGTIDVPRVYWQHAPLRNDEIETILRYHVLLHDETLRAEFGDQLRAAGHAHALAIEKIWSRIFLVDGKLVIEGFDFNFTEDARNSQSLSKIFSTMLEPLFEMRFPNHPVFTQPLGMSEVSSLVSDLFSGTRQNMAEVQRFAELFALPLGLVTSRNNAFVLETEENLLKLPLAQEVLALVKNSGQEMVSLRTVYRHLKREPVGLVREAQHLILTAMVANRQIEFVTTKGDRINRRSLDLKIIWDDIEGIALPAAASYPTERLTHWAKLLTGADNIHSINAPEDCEEITHGLRNWLYDWEKVHLLERFNLLPDEILNTKIWRLSLLADKTFGSVATTVHAILDESITLDEGLHRIADAFSDSDDEYYARTKDLVVLEDFISGTHRREEIRTYLAVCETTDDEKVENLREKLFGILEETTINPSQLTNREMENHWQAFQTRFSEYFAARHDQVMKSHHLQEQFDEIMRSNEWWEFENLSNLPLFTPVFRDRAQKICQQFRELDCRFNVRDMLKTHPFCACSFNLDAADEWEGLPEALKETIEKGRRSYRKILWTLRETLVQLITHFGSRPIDEEYKAASRHLVEIFKQGKGIPLLNNSELVILQKAFENLPTSLLLKTGFPPTNDFVTRDELKAQVEQWLDELPDEPVLLKV